MSAIRHVVFDLGGVLIRWEPETPFRRLIPDDAARHRFLTEICSPAWNLEQDRGRSWREAEDILIAEHPGKADLIRAYRSHWHDMIRGEIAETMPVFEALVESGVDLTALTNWSADTFDEAEARFPFLARFRGITVSGRIGLIKPDEAIFRHHTETFGLAPEATLFFDDNAVNVEAARAFGWHAEHFTGAGRMREDVERYGLLAG